MFYIFKKKHTLEGTHNEATNCTPCIHFEGIKNTTRKITSTSCWTTRLNKNSGIPRAKDEKQCIVGTVYFLTIVF